MHKKYKNDLINEINALSLESSEDVWRQTKINSEKKVRSKKKPSYLRKHGYNFFDNYFMITMKQMEIQVLQMTRTKQKICEMMKS